MKHVTSIVVLLFAACWLTCSTGHAQIVYWSNNFDTNAPKHWAITHAWHIDSPGEGPPLSANGSHSHSIPNCASTAGYPNNADGRVYCISYLSGVNSNLLVVPDASLSPTLNFWHWYHFANALGYVEIRTTNGWQVLSYVSGTASGWEQANIDLSPYAGQSIQIGFHFTSGGCCANGLGWYVDDVSVTETPTSPTLTMGDPQSIFAGQTFTTTITAANTLLPNDGYSFRLPTASTNCFITTAGVLSWTNTFLGTNGVLNWTNAISPGTVTITVIATDTNNPAFSGTNTLAVTISAPPGPNIIVPPTQTVALGQTFTVTNSATNSLVLGASYTFSVKPVATNIVNNATNIFNSTTNLTISAAGVLMWTNTSAPSGTNLVTVIVKDNSNPPLRATNVFAVIVSPPPLVIVPGTQTIHAGQTLAVPISATNLFLPAAQFTFSLPAPSTNYFINTNTGVLTWTNTFIATNGVFYWTNSVSPGTNVIYVTATDKSAPLMTATSNFNLVILPPLPPTLTVPANQTIFAGQTLVVTNHATNSVLTNCTYIFAASGPATLDVSNLPTNGVLKWVTGSTQTPGTYTITVTVTDNSVPPLGATNSFTVTVQSPPPPTLTVPPTQAIYVGQTLVVTNYATNSVFPNATYIFSLAFGPTNVNVSANGVLTWTPTAAQAPSINNIYIRVVDNNSPPLSDIEGFLVLVSQSPPPAPMLTTPAGPFPTGNGFQFKFKTEANTKWRIDACTNMWNWQPIFTNTADGNGNLLFTDPATNFTHRYYRAALP